MRKKDVFVIAKFKGANRSMGYVKGNEYGLFIKEHEETILITPLSGHMEAKTCPYDNIETFGDNWDVIKSFDINLSNTKTYGKNIKPTAASE